MPGISQKIDLLDFTHSQKVKHPTISAIAAPIIASKLIMVSLEVSKFSNITF